MVEKRGGVWFAALDIRGRVVGAGSLCPIDDRTARIDAFAHEEFPDARLSLLTSLWFDARELGFAECITEVATVDAEKQNDLEQLGFRVDQESTMTVPDGDSLPALRMTCPPSWGSA